jgi:superfamily II DNA or RNA helicase
MLFLCHTNDILRQSMLAYGKVFNGSRSMGMFTGEEKVDPKTVQFLFASFQTMNGWKDKFDPKDFDMIVVDESHHAQAETYRPTIEYFRPKYLLGMTATPDREDGKNIRDLFGDPSVTLSLEEAIARKYLSDINYKLMTVGTASRDAINELKRRVQAGERITLRELNDNIFIERLDSDIADDIMSYKAQGIIFCTDIKQAEGMAKLLKKARPYHSKLDRNELDADLEGFRRGRIKYLLTVDMFNEGIDVPDTELVVFLRSTESRTVYLQQLGRGLRKSPGKTHVTVLDFVGNCDRIKLVTDFMKKIGDYVPGDHRDYDDVIPREIDVSSIIFELDQEARDIRDIMRRLDVEFYPTMAEAMEVVRRLGIKTVTQYKERYGEDPRLPSNPNRIYIKEWRGYPYFLREEVIAPSDFYPKLKMAMAAIKHLGIRDWKTYVLRHGEDVRLPAQPHKVYRDEWTGRTFFLSGREKKPVYKTWTIASRASMKLGIKSSIEYKIRCSEDERLPRSPQSVYSDWPGWPIFFNQPGARKRVEPYSTLEEATKAAQRLKLDTVDAYKKGYKADPRLPSTPSAVYGSVWKGWPHYLRGEQRAKAYATYGEAAKAARVLGAQTADEYKKIYSRDERLRIKPDVIYPSEWKGWPHFLGTSLYASLTEAMEAVQKLGITNGKDYTHKGLYKADPRLPAHPESYYASEWKGWSHFLGKVKK